MKFILGFLMLTSLLMFGISLIAVGLFPTTTPYSLTILVLSILIGWTSSVFINRYETHDLR